MTTKYFILVVCLYMTLVCVLGDRFLIQNVIVITPSNLHRGEYFSYDVLLQAGDTSMVIVGAPKTKIKYYIEDNIKTIYKCSIEKKPTCEKLFSEYGRTINSNSTNGNFFGMSLDGEDHVNGGLVACAPRAVTSRTYNYLRGYCLFMRNTSQVNEHPVELQPLSNSGLYHDSACCDALHRTYYDFAFAMAGFDVSFYKQEKIEVLLGAPGVKKFNGATISYSIDDKGISLLPTRNAPVQADEDTYFGYSVTTAKFLQYSDETWFIAGAPRSNNLKGRVTIYFYDIIAKEKMNRVATFQGEEVGSYFGASVLALDVTNDRNIDILVGAPMAAGKTWDEGDVYFYKGLSETSFLQRVKLTGSGKAGSRFGTAIVSLGDFDLDGFNDVAISAPYEDSSKGAVYIYKGSSEGLTDSYSQRLSPSDFNVRGITAQGFGMGISRGNDIDGNGHNDIAVGAYKSDQVFIIKSYSVIDYEFLLTPNINTIINETSFEVQFCIIYRKRSHKDILPQVKFNLSINLDYRSIESKIIDSIDVDLGKTACKTYEVQVRHTMMDISPFELDLQIDIGTENIIAHGEKSLDIQIPFSHDCGSDNICETDLFIEVVSDSKILVLGLNKQIELTVKVNNSGEPAYQCEVKFTVSEGIELRNNKDCIINSRNYTCLIAEKVHRFSEKDFVFDLIDVKPDTSVIEIAAEVTSLGQNKGSYNNEASINISVVLDSIPYLVARKSNPEYAELTLTNTMQDLEVIHQFSVGKIGPSPLELNVDIFLPVVEQDGNDIFKISEVKGTIDTIQVYCTSTTLQGQIDFNELDDLKVPLNRTVVVTCNTVEKCLKYTCRGEYLYNSQVATFEVKLQIRSKLLVSKYKSELANKDRIALLPIISQGSPLSSVSTSALFLIFVDGERAVPLWVYLVAPTVGIILLMLISYGLYRCHFFDRVYKDKLDQEKILSNDGSVEEEIYDDVVFRSMDNNKQNEYL